VWESWPWQQSRLESNVAELMTNYIFRHFERAGSASGLVLICFLLVGHILDKLSFCGLADAVESIIGSK